jgi:hypothetical protein
MVHIKTEQKKQSRLTLWLVLMVCAAPILAAFIAYFSWQPQSRNNYGQLIEPQRPLPALSASTLDGQPFDMQRLRGKWIMLSADLGACDSQCGQKLYAMRQVRASTGDKQIRIERIWLVLDNQAVSPQLLAEHPGLHVVRAAPAQVQAFLPAPAAATVQAPIYLIDPLGNLMLQWPPQADMKRMRKDFGRLLWASRIG